MKTHYAIVFPGQGSQSLGMLAGLAAGYPVIQETYQEASEALGFDLWQLVQQGPEEKLNRTEHTQPALLAGSFAVWKILQTFTDTPPTILAGHSLGEYSALVCADSIAFTDAVSLVAKRGQYMQAAVAAGEGSMAAILGLENEKLIDLCNEISGETIVSPANFNSPGQVVIAGHTSAVEQVTAAAREAGAKRSVMLPVSVPSHCVLMRPAAEKLRDDLNNIQIKLPGIPVIHNTDASTKSGSDEIREALVKQLYLPVQWTRCVQMMISAGIEYAVECGPGKVLSGLIKRIDRKLKCYPAGDPDDLEKAVAALQGGNE